jgi:hypothetical protein
MSMSLALGIMMLKGTINHPNINLEVEVGKV